MWLTIKIRPKSELVLPIHYHSVLQGVIYHHLYDAKLANFLHDYGFTNGGRSFKLFVFSRLFGRYSIIKPKKQICFHDLITWHVSSVYPDFLHDFGQTLLTTSQIYISGQAVEIEEIHFSQPRIQKTSCEISMLSPVTIHTTSENEHGRTTHFFSPYDSMFTYHIEQNLKKKYAAFYGKEIEDEFTIRAVRVQPRDKVVTMVKNYFYVTAYMGKYHIEGPMELLNFALSVGIGSRNSYGFGMFEVAGEQ